MMEEMWVFGYGSLIWKAGFNYDDRLVGFVKGYRRVFYQGSTDHRGTPEFPGRTVTLEPANGEICWGVVYKISGKEDRDSALDYLEVREKQYDEKAYLDFFTDPAGIAPAIPGVMVYIGSADKERNQNYLGSAPLEDIANCWERVQLAIMLFMNNSPQRRAGVCTILMSPNISCLCFWAYKSLVLKDHRAPTRSTSLNSKQHFSTSDAKINT